MTASDTFRVVCPSCGQGFRVLVKNQGQTAKCMKCGTPIVLQPFVEKVESPPPMVSPPPAPTPAVHSPEEVSAPSELDEFEENEGGDFRFAGESADEYPVNVAGTSDPNTPPASPRITGGSQLPLIVGMVCLAVVVGVGGWLGYQAVLGSPASPAAPSPVANSVAAAPATKPARPIRPARPIPARTVIDPARTGIPSEGLAIMETTDLASDPSPTYDLQNAPWSSQSIQIAESGSVKRQLSSGPSVEFSVYIQFPILRKDDETSSVRCVIGLSGPSPIIVLEQKRIGGKTNGKMDILWGTGLDSATSLHEGTYLEALPSGWWTFRYHFGVLCVISPNEDMRHCATPATIEPVQSVRIEQQAGRSALRGLALAISGAEGNPAGEANYQKAQEDVVEAENKRLAGDLEGARQAIERATKAFAQMGKTCDCLRWNAEALSAELADISGDTLTADKLFGESIDSISRLLGPWHPLVVSAEFRRARSHWRRGQAKELLPIIVSTLDRWSQLLPKSPDFLMAATDASRCRAVAENPNTNGVVLRHLVEATRLQKGEDSDDYPIALERLARHLLLNSQADEAKAIQAKIQEMTKAKPGEGNRRRWDAMHGQARYSLLRGEYQDGIKEIDSLLEELEKNNVTSESKYLSLVSDRLELAGSGPKDWDIEEKRKAALIKTIEDQFLSKDNLTIDDAVALSKASVTPDVYIDADRSLRWGSKAIESIKSKEDDRSKIAFGIASFNRGRLYSEMNKPAEYRAAMVDAHRSFSEFVKTQSAGGDEGSWLSAMRVVDQFLMAQAGAGVDDPASAKDALNLLWEIRSSHMIHERTIRSLRSEPEMLRRYAEWCGLARRRAFLRRHDPSDLPAGAAIYLTRLEEDMKRLEEELTSKSSWWKSTRENPTVDAIQKNLPENVAFVQYVDMDSLSVKPSLREEPKGPGGLANLAGALLGVREDPISRLESELDKPKPVQRWNRTMSAFVVRPNKDVVWVDLKKRDSIGENLFKWRTTTTAPNDSARNDQTASKALKKAIWDPLEKHLEGVLTVMIDVDQTLLGVPLGALPGKKAGQFLVEDVAISQVTSPASLANPAPNESGDPSLLLVGNVDFNADTGLTTLEEGEFPYRPDTAVVRSIEEMSAQPESESLLKTVEEAFAKNHAGKTITRKVAGEATESTLRSAMPTHRYLHLDVPCYLEASQGNYEFRNVKIGQIIDLLGNDKNPGLHSGFLLAGAGRVPAFQQESKQFPDDGVFTHAEWAQIDLSKTELVVLSGVDVARENRVIYEAMETRHRAIEASGARSVLSSLWKTDLKAQQAFYREFYVNLWEKKMPKLDALRQAQIRMIKEYNPESGNFGLPETDSKDTKNKKAPLAPYFWGGYVLTGHAG